MADVKVPAKLHLMSKAAQKAWYKKNNMEMPKEKSVAQAGKIKPAEKKAAAPVKPKSAREISMERQKAYYAKGGRAPIGAGGSGGSSAMAGVGQSSAKEIIKGIKAGINPKVALVRYTQEQKVFETNGEYNRYGHPKAGSVDIDPTSSDKPSVYKKRPVARYKPKVEEATKQEAEKILGGPVKEKPKMAPGKQPAGYRYVRSLARKAMKAGMKKEEVEQTDEAAKDWQKAFSGVAQKNLQKDIGKMRSKVSRLKYVGAQPKVDASPKVTAQKTQKGMYSEEMQYIEEKLTSADPASKWISDFVASDNPKFAGKSKKERINMALGAYYAATGKGKKNEEVEQLSEGPSHYQYSGTIHSNVGNAKHGEEKDDGHSYTITIPRGGVHQGDLGSFLSSKKAFSRISRENPHLEPHHVLAVMHGTGDDVEDVKVDHKGKTYKHRLYNNQEPDYLYEEVEQIDEGVTHWEYTGTVNGKDYSLKIPRGANLIDHLSHKKIMKQNPHLEPHEAKAVAETSGEDEEHVEVEHNGKKYTHHVTNDPEARMVYSEEVEQVEEKYMGFKAVMASAKKGGARDPAAVAAAIGRKKYGKEKFQAMAAAGKKANEEVDTGEADARKIAPSSKEKQKEVFAKHKERMKKLGEGMDPVGREDKDIDNDGDTDKTDVYLHNKRKAIRNAIRKKLAAKLEKKDGE